MNEFDKHFVDFNFTDPPEDEIKITNQLNSYIKQKIDRKRCEKELLRKRLTNSDGRIKEEEEKLEISASINRVLIKSQVPNQTQNNSSHNSVLNEDS